MKAFLLAAGKGTRLGSLTQSIPKCLLPVGGRPLLDYWFDALQRAGVTEVLINLHHHADQVNRYLDHLRPEIRVERFYEPDLLGSAGTIHQAWSFVEDQPSFFIVYADNFARVELKRLWDFHLQRSHPILTLVAYPTDTPNRCGIVELDPDGRVVSFEEKPAAPRSHFANAGIHVASAELYEFLPSAPPADLAFHVLPKLVGRMFGYVTDEFILDIGTPETYERAQHAATPEQII